MQEMQETWVWFLGQEDALKKEMASHPTIPPWKIQWTEEPEGLQSMGLQRVRHDWACTHMHTLWIIAVFDHASSSIKNKLYIYFYMANRELDVRTQYED